MNFVEIIHVCNVKSWIIGEIIQLNLILKHIKIIHNSADLVSGPVRQKTSAIFKYRLV